MKLNLFDESDLKIIAKFISDQRERIDYNRDIFKILEGNLQGLLEERMVEDLGHDSFAQAKTRTAPINVFKKIVNKQTSIYNNPVFRTVENGTEKDISLLRWYESALKVNQKFHKNNGFFNAYLYSLMQITLTDVNEFGVGKPFIRTNPNHEFLIMSTSETNPTSPDIVILFMPDCINDKGDPDKSYHVMTDEQFVIINGQGTVHWSEMDRYEQKGINPYGTTPFVYTNASENLSMPMIQTDNKEMALLIPLLLTDLNYACKFQAFSTFIAIDCDDTKVKLSPNTIMHFKSDGSGNAPSFDVIKPTIDISETLSLASSEMSLWLTSKGIRAGSIGQLGTDQFASGVSKMIDESDTYESVKEQITIYQDTENQFWEKLLKQIHPFWVSAGRIENTDLFSPNATVKTVFTQPKPLQSRQQLITELAEEVAAGFTSVETAVKKLNPEMSQDAVKELIEQTKAEMRERRPAIGGMNGQEQTDETDS